MKKIFTLLLVFVVFIGYSQIRMVEVEPSTNTITIKNFGNSMVDISSYRLCALIKYTSNLTTGITINSGSMNLAPGAEVEIVAPGGASSSWQDLQAVSDLGLYLPSGSFGSADAMVDFVQWGGGGQGRESVANVKGIWSSGDFVSGTAPYSYAGDGSQNGVSFWSGVTSGPTDIALISSSVPENAASDVFITDITTTDAVGTQFTYSLVAGDGDTDNASFQILTGALAANESFNFEVKDQYSIRIQTENENAETFSKAFTINITDENDDPTDISLDNASVDEGSSSGTTVGTLSTTDEDGSDSHTYTLVAGMGDTNNILFSISGTELQTAADITSSEPTQLSIRVKTTDSENAEFEKQISITKNPVTSTWQVSEGQIDVYPNPSTGNINIRLNSTLPSGSNLKVLDSKGLVVRTMTLTKSLEYIPIETGFAPGLYQLILSDAKGEVIHRTRIIKK